MKKLFPLLLIFLVPFILVSQSSKKVLIIGIDGCRPDALQKANTPNIDQLIGNGIFSPDALNDDITISGPGWSAILCGVRSNKHLVTGNNFAGNNYEEYPSIFKYVEDHNSNLHTVSFCHWAPINNFIVQDHADFKLNLSTGLEVSTQASDYLAVNDPDVIFLHFDDVDHAGHANGFSPEVAAYISAIEGVDTYLGPIFQAIEQRPNYANEDWLILLSTDHGGNGFSHGGNTIDEQNVFVLASGKNIASQLIEKDSLVIIDNPVNCLGDSIELRFDGDDDFVQIPADPIFDFGATQDFTIECRVRTSASGDVAIIGNKDWDSGNNKGFIFSFKFPSGPEWKVNIGDGSNRVDINTGGAIADSEWHTLSVSFDRDGWMKMYQDGAIADSAMISSIGDISTNEGLFFGADINGAYTYSGAIAEVRVWNGLLEGSTIEDWHCRNIESTHPDFDDLLAYWKMTDNMGNMALTDYSANANNGMIQGAVWGILDSTIVYDYNSTPRLTDFLPTALNHLCIPIKGEWALDGSSLIPECIVTNRQEPLLEGMQLFPNPATDIVRVQFSKVSSTEPIIVTIYNSTGIKIREERFTQTEFNLDVSDFTEGIYLIAIEQEGKQIVKELVLKRQR